jgi:hypothetical protein
MTDRECNFVNSNQAKRSLDPWCTSHERSATCCIRALREERDARSADATSNSKGWSEALAKVHQLETTIARVEALPAKWRGKKPRGTGTMTTGEVAVVQYAFQDAADDLEAALKAKP